MVALPNEKLLVLEIRDEINRQVSFSALQYETNIFLWEDFTLGDPWWASLLAARGSVLLIQTYTTQDNPDAKALYALDLSTKKVLWQMNDFSFTGFTKRGIAGLSGREEPVIVELSLSTGSVISREMKLDLTDDEISGTVRPFQYQEGTPYHEMASKFLVQRHLQRPQGTIEYQEHEGLIFISYYTTEESGLANYLLVLNEQGEKLFHEKIDEQLKGLGVDTFFILSGCLFFVRNKRELLSYQII